MENLTNDGTILFGEFELNGAKRLLLKNGRVVRLNPKAFDLLTALAENRGRVLSKDELLEKVWPGQFVEENNLTVHISALRKIFGEKKGEHQFIATIPGRGYCFVAEATAVSSAQKRKIVSAEPVESVSLSNRAAHDSPPPPLASTIEDDSAENGGLIGRRREIEEIKNLLLRRGEKNLITLTGAGGTGKTSLARAIQIESAADFPDGIFFVDLAAVAGRELVPQAVAQTLGVKESGETSISSAVTDFLSGRRTLLILDNFEHVLAAADFVVSLLSASPLSLKILVTSRAPLRVRREHEVAVAPLAIPPRSGHLSETEIAGYAAVRLFAARARAVKPGFSLTAENAAFVAEICRRLDGLPLAIELAAARVRLLSPQSILTRLDDSLTLLAGGAKDLPARQQTIRAAVEWSYNLLSEDEKTLLRRLSVFAGGFTVAAAEAVCQNYELRMDNNEADKIRIQNPESRITVLDGITSLLDNNLLVLLSEEPDNSGDARLRMLEVVREFAREALRESGELESACRRHARFFMALAEQAEPHLLSARAVEWLDKLEDEIDNLRAALRWALRAEPETAVKIASATLQFWIFRSYLTEGREWLNAALAQSAAAASSSSAAGGGSQAEMRLNLFHGLGILARIQGDYAAAREIYEQYLAESRAAGNDRRLALSSNGLGTILRLQGERSAARECFEEGLRLSRRSNDPKAVAYSLLCLGIALGLDGEPTRARRLLEESLTILREFGNKEAISNNLNNLGSVAFDEGDYDAARRYFTEGLRISREVGNKVNITDALNGLGALAAERGDFRTAAELAGAAEALSQSIGFSREPAEKAFCDTYIAKTRANLSDENFAEAFESGRAGSLETALALAEGKFRSGEEDQFAEIVIEERSFSRVVIEEEEEIAEPAEKNITPRRNV